MLCARTICIGLVVALPMAGHSSGLTSAAAQNTRRAPPGGSTSAMPSSDRAALARALVAYDQGRAEEARPVLQELIRRYPGSFEATETLGLIEAEGGDFGSALSLLQKASAMRPSSALAQANLGTAYLKLNRIDDAVRTLQRSAALDAKNRGTQSALGQALMQAGQPGKAATAFAAANAGASPDLDLLYNWAVALLEAGDAKGAGEVITKIPGRESSAQVQALWGDVEEKNGNYTVALQHYQQAAQLDASETNLDAFGLELMRDGIFPAATRAFEYGAKKYPASAKLQLGLGLAKYGSDDYAGAVRVFSLLLEREPENNLYAELLGRNCIMIDKWQDSGCDLLERIASGHPSNAGAALYIAKQILRQPQGEEDTSRARKLLDQAIAANPKLADAYFEVGVLDQQEMRWQESAAMLGRAIALRPNDAEAHYRLARAYAHTGKRDEALREIALQQKYSEKDESNQTIRMREVATFLTASH